MKTNFTVSRNKLLSALLRCKHAINMKHPIPAYANYLFSFENDRLLVAATDGDIFIRESLPLDQFEGDDYTAIAFALDKNYLLKAIKSLDDQPLSFEIGDYQVRVTHSLGQFWIARSEALDVLEDSIKRNTFGYYCKNCKPDVKGVPMEIPGIKHWIDVCNSSTDDDFLRPAMNCVCLDFRGNYQLNIAASDGHQLAIIEKEEQDGVDFEARLLLSRKVCEIIRTCLPKTGMMELGFTEYRYGDTGTENEYEQKALGCFTVNLDEEDPYHILFVRFRDYAMDSRYPNYMSVVPTSVNYKMECDRKQLLKSINRVVQFANHRFRMLRFTLVSDKMKLSADDNDFEVGACEEMPCRFKLLKGVDLYKGEMRVAFRGDSIASILQRITTEKVVISYVDSSRACIIQPDPQPSVEKVTFILMPMNDGN